MYLKPIAPKLNCCVIYELRITFCLPRDEHLMNIINGCFNEGPGMIQTFFDTNDLLTFNGCEGKIGAEIGGN